MTTHMLSPKQHFQSAVKRTIFVKRLSTQPSLPPQPQLQPQSQSQSQSQPQKSVALQHMVGRSPSIMSGGLGVRSS